MNMLKKCTVMFCIILFNNNQAMFVPAVAATAKAMGMVTTTYVVPIAAASATAIPAAAAPTVVATAPVAAATTVVTIGGAIKSAAALGSVGALWLTAKRLFGAHHTPPPVPSPSPATVISQTACTSPLPPDLSPSIDTATQETTPVEAQLARHSIRSTPDDENEITVPLPPYLEKRGPLKFPPFREPDTVAQFPGKDEPRPMIDPPVDPNQGPIEFPAAHVPRGPVQFPGAPHPAKFMWLFDTSAHTMCWGHSAAMDNMHVSSGNRVAETDEYVSSDDEDDSINYITITNVNLYDDLLNERDSLPHVSIKNPQIPPVHALIPYQKPAYELLNVPIDALFAKKDHEGLKDLKKTLNSYRFPNKIVYPRTRTKIDGMIQRINKMLKQLEKEEWIRTRALQKLVTDHTDIIKAHTEGDLAKLREKCDQLRKAIPSCPTAQERAQLDRAIERIEQRINDSMTKSLHTIKTADLETAKSEYEALVQAYATRSTTMKYGGALKIGHAHDYLHHYGFDHLQAAKAILESRPDYQTEISASHMTAELPTTTAVAGLGTTTTTSQLQVTEVVPAIDVQNQIIQSLVNGQDRSSLADSLGLLAHDVFTQTSVYNYVDFPHIEIGVQRSIDIIKTTTDAHEFAFHVALVDHVLSDIQNQTATPVHAPGPTMLQRSPELLTRAISQYWKNLAPTETEISFVCDLARYISDVTLGTNYLSAQVREQRVQTFWQTVDALSSLRLSDITWENGIDKSMYIAARATWALGLGQVCTVVKNIKNACTISQTAASLVDKFLGVLEGVIGGSPIIGADGTAIGTISSRVAADVVKVVAVAAANEEVELPPALFDAQDKEPIKESKAPGTQGKSNKSGSSKPEDMTDNQLLKGIKKMNRNIKEHAEKLAQYIKDPDGNDHLGFLKRAKDLAQRNQTINGRIKHLSDEIKGWTTQIKDMTAELIKRGVL